MLKRYDKLIVDILSRFVAFYATNFCFRISYFIIIYYDSSFENVLFLILFASMLHFYNTYNFLFKNEKNLHE